MLQHSYQNCCSSTWFANVLQQIRRDLNSLQQHSSAIPAHVNGGLWTLVGHPRLGEVVVVVGPSEHTGDQGKSRTGSECAPPYCLTVRWVFKYHSSVTSVVGGLHQPSQQARLRNEKCQPAYNNRKSSVSILRPTWMIYVFHMECWRMSNIHWKI